jgi:crossover junction endodeoxyribonuclease RuvC
VKSALTLGHARGVAVLAGVQAGVPIVEYSPAEVKQAIAGYGRAEKPQMQRMVQLLLGLDTAPKPHDAADALALAICHAHLQTPVGVLAGAARAPRHLRSWRHVKLPIAGRQAQ